MELSIMNQRRGISQSLREQTRKIPRKNISKLVGAFFPGALAISVIAKFVSLYLDPLPFHSFSDSVVTRVYYVIVGAIALWCIVYFLLSGIPCGFFFLPPVSICFRFSQLGRLTSAVLPSLLIDKNAIIFRLLYVLSVFYLSLLNTFYAYRMLH